MNGWTREGCVKHTSDWPIRTTRQHNAFSSSVASHRLSVALLCALITIWFVLAAGETCVCQSPNQQSKGTLNTRPLQKLEENG